MSAGQTGTGGPAGALPRYGSTVWRLREGTLEDSGPLDEAYAWASDTGGKLERDARYWLDLRDAINAAIIGWQYEWEECPDRTWAMPVGPNKHPPGPAHDPCPTCADHATYGLKPGQVRVGCRTCDKSPRINEAQEVGMDQYMGESRIHICPDCLDGYKGRKVNS